MSQNWIQVTNNPEMKVISLQDKVKILLEPSNAIKLVEVQKTELENLQKRSSKGRNANYINYLYNHYIVHNLPKTYLC